MKKAKQGSYANWLATVDELSGVVLNDTEQQFELVCNGDKAVLQFRLQGDTLDFYRTYVPESCRGGGRAGQLAKAAMDYARAQEKRVRASCSYIQHYLAKHPEYQDLQV